MSYNKNGVDVAYFEESIGQLYELLDNISSEDLYRNLLVLADMAKMNEGKLEMKEKLESLLIDFMEYPVEVLGEAVEVLAKFELPDAEFSVNAVDFSVALTTAFAVPEYMINPEMTKDSSESLEEISLKPTYPVVEISGKVYEKVPEDEDCEGCFFSKESGGCAKDSHQQRGVCSSEEIIFKEVFKEVFTDD